MKLMILLLLFVVTNTSAQTGTVKGRVFDGSAVPFLKPPLAGASVQTVRTHIGAATDTAGYFAIHGLLLGPCSLQVSSVGFEREVVRVDVEPDPAKQNNIEIVLLQECVMRGMPQVYRVPLPDSLRESTLSAPKKPLSGKCTLTGHVTDKETGKPITSARISAAFDFWSEEGRRTGCCFGGPVDSTGRYALNHSDPGQYNLSACAEGYDRSARLIEIRDDSVYTIDFELVKETTQK